MCELNNNSERYKVSRNGTLPTRLVAALERVKRFILLYRSNPSGSFSGFVTWNLGCLSNLNLRAHILYLAPVAAAEAHRVFYLSNIPVRHLRLSNLNLRALILAPAYSSPRCDGRLMLLLPFEPHTKRNTGKANDN
jgi:hypothetical protein